MVLAKRLLPDVELSFFPPGCMLQASTMTTQPPNIACNLTSLTPEERDRRASLAATMKSTLRSVKELPDGYRVSLSGEMDQSQIEELIDFEERCCPFLTFTLAIETDGTTLDIVGPPGTKEFLTSTFGI